MYNFKINYGPEVDDHFCNGCGNCHKYCPMDIFGWDDEKKRPTVAHPAECWFCCFCEILCPQVAINVRLPLHHMIDFGIDPRKVTSVVDEFQRLQDRHEK